MSSRRFITTVIKEEILREDSPETEVFKNAINRWIIIIDYKGKPKEFRKYGLDAGEASLFLAAETNDRLVLDEANARRFVESKGLKFTGLIGLIVAAVGAKKITKELALETMLGNRYDRVNIKKILSTASYTPSGS